MQKWIKKLERIHKEELDHIEENMAGWDATMSEAIDSKDVLGKKLKQLEAVNEGLREKVGAKEAPEDPGLKAQVLELQGRIKILLGNAISLR